MFIRITKHSKKDVKVTKEPVALCAAQHSCWGQIRRPQFREFFDRTSGCTCTAPNGTNPHLSFCPGSGIMLHCAVIKMHSIFLLTLDFLRIVKRFVFVHNTWHSLPVHVYGKQGSSYKCSFFFNKSTCRSCISHCCWCLKKITTGRRCIFRWIGVWRQSRVRTLVWKGVNRLCCAGWCQMEYDMVPVLLADVRQIDMVPVLLADVRQRLIWSLFY